MFLKNFLPILEWLPKYNKHQLKGDVYGGLTIGVMLIPQGMAYAMLAGLPPIFGLYAAIIPLILYGILGTSRHLSVGPAAMVALLVSAGVSSIVAFESQQYVPLAIALTLMVGGIQFFMGVFRLGFLVNFLSYPVISGFTSAAAFIIGFSQLKHLLGLDIERSNYIYKIIRDTAAHLHEINIITFLIGTGCILLLFIIKKYKFLIPGPILIVIVGILSVKFLGLENKGVEIVGQIPGGLPNLKLPIFGNGEFWALLPLALTIAVISFMGSVAIAKAIQNKHPYYRIRANQELIALGMANIVGSFSQAFPVSGGFSRTAVNAQAGSKTGIASIISALLVAITLLFLTTFFYYLPKAVLAAIIMMAVASLVDIKGMRYLWKADRSDFWMLLLTFLGTLLLGIEEGIVVGIMISLGMMIYRTARPHVAVLGKIPNGVLYRNLDRFDNLEISKEVLIVRFDARLYFANTSYFKETIERLIFEKGKDLKLLVLDAESMNNVDSSGIRALQDIFEFCQNKHLKFYICSVKGPIRDTIHRSDLLKIIDENHFFLNIQNAIDCFYKKDKQLYKKYILQTNSPKLKSKK